MHMNRTVAIAELCGNLLGHGLPRVHPAQWACLGLWNGMQSSMLDRKSKNFDLFSMLNNLYYWPSKESDMQHTHTQREIRFSFSFEPMKNYQRRGGGENYLK